MKNLKFKRYLHDFANLNTLQERVLKNVIVAKDSIKYVSMNLENKGVISCPHCSNTKIQFYGKRNDLQRYKCKECKKTFNSLTGTPLARLRKKGHWLEYSDCLVKGLTIRNAATCCSISNATSFRWRHRFLNNSKKLFPKEISGIVEAFESFIPKSKKGEKKLDRKPRKRGLKLNKYRGQSDNVCLFFARDRHYNTYSKIFESFNSKGLAKELIPIMLKDSLFCSDNKKVYTKFAKDSSIRHGYINISQGEIVKKDIVHINNVNSYHDRLRKWMSRFNGVATKYLDSYLSWYRELDEFNMSLPPITVLLRAKTLVHNEYQPLIRT